MNNIALQLLLLHQHIMCLVQFIFLAKKGIEDDGKKEYPFGEVFHSIPPQSSVASSTWV